MNFPKYKKILWQWAEEQVPVFIVGSERSGTSLLFQQVSNHPSFCNFSLATVETFCFVKPWLLLDNSGPENYVMRVYLGLQGKLEQFQQNIKPLVERNLMLTDQGMSKPYIYEENRQEIWTERRYKHIIRAFFYESWIHLGQKRLVEKTPAHIRCTDEILKTFPKAKILVCTRDIGEIIASHKKRYNKEIELGKHHDDRSIAWLGKSTDDYLKYFRGIDYKIKKLQAISDQSLIVPYGDL